VRREPPDVRKGNGEDGRRGAKEDGRGKGGEAGFFCGGVLGFLLCVLWFHFIGTDFFWAEAHRKTGVSK